MASRGDAAGLISEGPRYAAMMREDIERFEEIAGKNEDKEALKAAAELRKRLRLEKKGEPMGFFVTGNEKTRSWTRSSSSWRI